MCCANSVDCLLVLQNFGSSVLFSFVSSFAKIQIVMIIKEDRHETEKKEPHKESQDKKPLRIKAKKERSSRKRAILLPAIKKLKREGKVQLISGSWWSRKRRGSLGVLKGEKGEDWQGVVLSFAGL